MATTTPNYGWDVPTSTDYVKDGATAIETLGDDIDATLYTALGGAYPGLRLIKTQTIGSAVSSVTVTSAFSATYENYKIVISGGASAAVSFLSLKLGASATQYYQGRLAMTYSSNTTNNGVDNNAVAWTNVGGANGANGIHANIDLISPFLAKYTGLGAVDMRDAFAGFAGGIHKVATSYTDFTITPSGTTLTGGTIYVYGYGIS
jgi:hypothetical protein